MGDVSEYILTKPETLWIIVLVGAVAVIGITDFIKHFVKNKTASKWIVLVVSLVIAIILSPLVPSRVTTVIMLWLLILALATMARNAIVDGLLKRMDSSRTGRGAKK